MGTWPETRIEELGGLTLPTAAAEDDGGWPEAEFAAVFQQHYARVVGVAARLVGDRGAAEEIADDTFWKLYQRPGLRAGGQNLAAWLYRTASRAGIDALRSRRRRLKTQEQLAAEPAPRSAASPLQTLERLEVAARVRRVLGRLKPAQTQMLVLRHSGLSYLEVAAALGINPNSVGTLLARAQSAFENAYREEHDA